MMAGLTIAAGSYAFENMAASHDTFTVQQLRSGGASTIGKINMPPMVNGGMQCGLYSRAESSYDKAFLIAAYALGASNGAGTRQWRVWLCFPWETRHCLQVGLWFLTMDW
ncbi:hypothetical protein BJY01DRAFT_202902 [Aspergillus pseudoustus]|uniref:Uncharacterized protein n=1 Tax=Aspergillus pseudoustus TaxID=1810923 RepID=A0ABR4KY27_9EURO